MKSRIFLHQIKIEHPNLFLIDMYSIMRSQICSICTSSSLTKVYLCMTFWSIIFKAVAAAARPVELS